MSTSATPDIAWKISPEPAPLTREEFWARYDHRSLKTEPGNRRKRTQRNAKNQSLMANRQSAIRNLPRRTRA